MVSFLFSLWAAMSLLLPSDFVVSTHLFLSCIFPGAALYGSCRISKLQHFMDCLFCDFLLYPPEYWICFLGCAKTHDVFLHWIYIFCFRNATSWKVHIFKKIISTWETKISKRNFFVVVVVVVKWDMEILREMNIFVVSLCELNWLITDEGK